MRGIPPKFLRRFRKFPSTNRVALVTGGAGFIGSNLCRRLVADGWRVYCVDNLITGRRSNIEDLESSSQFRFMHLDVTERMFVDAFRGIAITHVFHLACPTGVPNIARLGEEMLLTSSIGTKHALELAQRHDARFVFSSSAEVYGDPLEFPQHEQYAGNVSPVGPRSAYEEGKRFGETLVTTFSKKYRLRANVIRIFNTYGPGMSLEDQRVIPQFINALLNNEPLRIYGDGLQTRAHLFVTDLIEGVLRVTDGGQPGEVYNIGGNKQTTIRELADLLITISRRPGTVEFVPHFITDHRGRLPSIEKIAALGWRQSVDLESGLERMARAYGLLEPMPALTPEKGALPA